MWLSKLQQQRVTATVVVAIIIINDDDDHDDGDGDYHGHGAVLIRGLIPQRLSGGPAVTAAAEFAI